MSSEGSGRGEEMKGEPFKEKNSMGGRVKNDLIVKADDTGNGEPSKPQKLVLKRLNHNSSISRGRDAVVGTNLGGRLTHTFKTGNRDLTLGARITPISAKKQFKPNLNAVRQIKKEPEETSAAKDGARKKHDRKRRSDKHEKKNKNRPELIQTMDSVFAQGIAGECGIRRRGASLQGEKSGEGSQQMQRPKLEIKQDAKFDKEDEKERLQALLKDNFIDDLLEGSYVPVQLPMVDTGKIFKEEVKLEKEDDEDNIKPDVLNKKTLPELDSDDSDSPAAEAAGVTEAVIDKKPELDKKHDIYKEIDIADLVKTQKGDLLFIQLPDHLPGTVPTPVGDGPDGIKDTPSGSVHGGTVPSESVLPAPRCTLADIPEGQIGKLQIRRSGVCQLSLGDQILDVEVGTRVGFLQDAVSVKLPPSGGVADMTVLGHVKHRLVITPNWKDLLSKIGLDSEAA